MRNYYIEDISDENIDLFEEKLGAMEMNGPIKDIYYLPIPEDMLSDEQEEHKSECGPYFLALEVIRNVAGNIVKMELLVRAHGKIRCSCVAYCTQEQRNRMIDYLDDLFEDFGIKV